ncbi:MAG: caspase family protein [Acidimicrobiales bacterium]
MRALRWTTALLTAVTLLLASVTIFVRLDLMPRTAATAGSAQRALPVVAPPPGVTPQPAPPNAAETAAPGAEVAIVPPGELVGELAEPSLPPPEFVPSRSGGGAGEVFALVIGIDDYPGSKSDLRSAVADADTIDAALHNFGVPAGNRVVLRDGQARLGNVTTAIRSLVAQGGRGSTLVFAYAGHVRKLDQDTEQLVLADGATMTDVELAGLLAPALDKRMWLLLATCYAGGFTEAMAPGRILTGAADANHLAYESSALNASYLVHHMVRQAWLEGASGPSVQDAYAHAFRSLRQNPRRRPYQLDWAGGPLLLGPGGAGAPAPAQPLNPPPAAPAPESPPPGNPPPSSPPPDGGRTCPLVVVYCRH